MRKVLTAAVAVAAPLLISVPTADATQPAGQRQARTLAHIETTTSSIYTALINGGGNGFYWPAVTVYVDVKHCIPTSTDGLSEEVTLMQDGVTVSQPDDHPGSGLTWCPPSGSIRIQAEVAGPQLHPGKVQVTFTLYGPSGVIIQQSGISRIPAS
jgi:hypothetical protein